MTGSPSPPSDILNLTDPELKQIIATGESDRVEFKESLSDPSKIRQAICALANDLPGHDQPGFVIVGVKDDGTMGDLTVTDALLRQLADMKTDGNIVPPPSLTVEKRTLQGAEVAVVTVQPSTSPPVRFKGAIHVRVGPRRGIATAQDESTLNEKRRHGDRPFDIQPIPTAGLSDLDLTQFENEYLPRAVSDEVLTANDRSMTERLAATKMIVTVDQPTATVLGILTMGKNPQDFLPGAYIQFLRIDGLELTDDVLDSDEMGGSIPDMMRNLDGKLRAHNRTAVEFTKSDIERRTEFCPMEALQQIARNAVMHRTYEGTNAPVRITWFNDRIEIMSPGSSFGVVNADNFGQSGYTDYRNPNLAEAMKTLGYVQRFGVGIAIAKRQLASAGHPEPEFLVSDRFVVVTIRVKRKQE